MSIIAVTVILLGVSLCIAMAINEARRKRTETPELDKMIFQREGDEEDE
jgi:hypothetical protein